ncbi:MAG: 1-acyl-sn-glycerol-3-phosphate acyltransferase [Solirubrobacteraceae bacterium]
MDLERLHQRARLHRANPVVYGFVRVTFQVFFLIYFRMQRIGLEHIPRRGPVILAANHRSFLDPFVIACMARRPMYYVAKKEIFHYSRVVAWLLAALGAFPIDRGAADEESMATARAILARGEIVLIFPEGTRTRPGVLGRPRRGVGRLALETGAPVVPVAVIGTEAVRRGWRIRPHKVRIRAGRALRFPRVGRPSMALAGAVTDRIWPCVMLQWEWLGGLPPARRATIIGTSPRGTGLAACLSRAGVEVDLAYQTPEQGHALQAARESARPSPAATLPDAVRILPIGDLTLREADVICLAVSAKELPTVLGATGERITRRTGIVLACDGIVPPLGTLPSAFAAERCNPRAVAVLGGPAPAEALVGGAAAVVASLDAGFARQLADPLRAAGLVVSISTDVIGVELAGCASYAAALAVAVVAPDAGASVAGAAAGKVFAEINALARARGARPETFSGVAGAGALVAAVIAAGPAYRPDGTTAEQNTPPAGRDGAGTSESIALLLTAAHSAHVRAPVLDSLVALIEGRIGPDQWAASVIPPAPGVQRDSGRAV